METITLGKNKTIPVERIDYFGIDSEDEKSLRVHTVGGFTVVNKYESEEDCLKDYNKLYEIIKDYNYGRSDKTGLEESKEAT